MSQNKTQNAQRANATSSSGDERVVRAPEPGQISEDTSDERLSRDTDTEGRGDRGASDDRLQFDDLSADEFAQLMANEFEQTALPTPPKLAGYHLCWLTANSRYDPLNRRHKLGYRPVRKSEMPGFDPTVGVGGLLKDFDAYVTCNELVLHKLPEALYQRMMTHYHHDKPLQEQRVQIQKATDDDDGLPRDSSGRRPATDMEEGLLDLQKSTRRETSIVPRF